MLNCNTYSWTTFITKCSKYYYKPILLIVIYYTLWLFRDAGNFNIAVHLRPRRSFNHAIVHNIFIILNSWFAFFAIAVINIELHPHWRNKYQIYCIDKIDYTKFSWNTRTVQRCECTIIHSSRTLQTYSSTRKRNVEQNCTWSWKQYFYKRSQFMRTLM